jgi:hypothetical protein
MRTALLAFLLLLAPLAPAATVDLGAHGTLSIEVPKGWKLSSQKAEETGYAITLTPPDGVNARCILSVAYVDPGEPMSREKAQAQVLSIADQFVDASVEKKAVLHDLSLKSGYGYYCTFTDASMVGKPPAKDEFKMVGVAVLKLADDLMAAVSMAADDEKGPDFEAMLAAVSSAAVRPKAGP